MSIGVVVVVVFYRVHTFLLSHLRAFIHFVRLVNNRYITLRSENIACLNSMPNANARNQPKFLANHPNDGCYCVYMYMFGSDFSEQFVCFSMRIEETYSAHEHDSIHRHTHTLTQIQAPVQYFNNFN